MLNQHVNRWAIETYLEAIAKQVERPVFAAVAKTLKENKRPNLNDVEEFFIERVKAACDQYMLLENLAFKMDDHLISIEVSDERRAAIIGAVMIDSTERDLVWERNHNRPSSGRILVVNGATGEKEVY